MEAKFLFFGLNLVLTLGLFAALGASSRTDVLAHWSERRCDFDVLMMSFMYKPDGDLRSISEFSSDNLNFCISSKSTNYLETLFGNLFEVMKKQMAAGDIMTQVFKVLRTQLNSIYAPFASMMNRFFTKFKQIGSLASRIFQHLYMSMKKAAATGIASIFVALSLQTAFLNSIDLIIKVIMIVLYILLGLAVIFFLPILPFLVIVLITVAGIEKSMPGSTGSMGSIFCFAKDTNIILKGGGLQNICLLKPGDILDGDTEVQAVIEVPGEELYSLDGVLVSGYHCIYEGEEVVYVRDHPRSKKSLVEEKTLWTLITSKREIPIMGLKGPLRFLDWDEIPDSKEAEKAWDLVADGILNGKLLNKFMVPSSAPCIDPNMSVYKYQGGWRPMKDIKIGDWIRYSDGWTQVTGRSERKVHTAIGKQGDRISDGNWILDDSSEARTWIHPSGKIENVTWDGLHFITDSGTFVIRLNSGMQLVVRDFTEVGSQQILDSHTRVERLLEPQALGDADLVPAA